jgi:putative SOS response-associated peptidase YedK
MLKALTREDVASRERSMKPASINLASSKRCAASVVGRARAADYAPDALQRGLIPYWAKDPKIAYRTINARDPFEEVIRFWVD